MPPISRTFELLRTTRLEMRRKPSSLIVVQHHPAGGLGELGRWANQHGIKIVVLRTNLLDRLPDIGSGLPVVLLGGPYSLMDPPIWLQRERLWVRELVVRGAPVFGISLGAQLLAEALGASVFALPELETGWISVRFVSGRTLDVLQWHDESFTLPPGALLHGSSDRCTNQYFSVGETLVGVQFHPEWNAESVSDVNFSFGAASPLPHRGKLDTRRHNAVSAWFHARLDRWITSASNARGLARVRARARKWRAL